MSTNSDRVIYTQNADVTGDGVLDTIFLNGRSRSDNPEFYEEVVLAVRDGSSGQTYIQSLAPDNAGYNPRFMLCDFNKDGLLDILTSIDSGGSGAFVYNKLVTVRGGQFHQLFNVAVFNTEFRGQAVYLNDYRVEVTIPRLGRRYLIDVSDRKELYQGRIYSKDGRLLEPTMGEVSDLNVLYPTQDGKYCGLLALQRVIGLFGADTLGYLETNLRWGESGFVPVSQIFTK